MQEEVRLKVKKSTDALAQLARILAAIDKVKKINPPPPPPPVSVKMIMRAVRAAKYKENKSLQAPMPPTNKLYVK